MHSKRVRQIFPENLFRQSRYIHARGLIRLVGIVQLQDLFTWPCLLCARVIHFFLFGYTSRRVVDRTHLYFMDDELCFRLSEFVFIIYLFNCDRVNLIRWLAKFTNLKKENYSLENIHQIFNCPLILKCNNIMDSEVMHV